MIREAWIEHDGARLHYLQAGDVASCTPLVYVPGSLGSADDFRSEMARLAPRPIVAVSPRGLGKSSAPARGYSFAHRVADLQAVLDSLPLPPFCVMAFSLGVPVVLRYASRNAGRVAGLILLDYPARHPARTGAWVERALPFAHERGVPERVVRRLHEESEAIELWPELPRLTCPVLIVKGGLSPSISASDLALYREALPQARIAIFEDAGHEVFRPDYERFMREVEAFLTALD